MRMVMVIVSLLALTACGHNQIEEQLYNTQTIPGVSGCPNSGSACSKGRG